MPVHAFGHSRIPDHSSLFHLQLIFLFCHASQREEPSCSNLAWLRAIPCFISYNSIFFLYTNRAHPAERDLYISFHPAYWRPGKPYRIEIGMRTLSHFSSLSYSVCSSCFVITRRFMQYVTISRAILLIIVSNN